jgi:hypothetical protein
VPFSGPLETRQIGPEQWVILKGFSFINDWTEIYVPDGFITDKASIPKALRSVVSKAGYWNQPAVLHDFLYRNHSVPRKDADRLLYEACADMEEGWQVPWYRQRKRMIYAAVRAGGWASY